MAPKVKKALKDSIEDVLGDLLGDDTSLLDQPVKLTASTRNSVGADQVPSRARTKSFLGGDARGTAADSAGAKAEDSDISEADPKALLQTMKDLDDMDADLFKPRASALAPSRAATKGSGDKVLQGTHQTAGGAIPSKKLPGKFSFEDMEDPLAGLLSDDEGSAEKPLVETENPAPVRGPGPPVPLTPGDTPIHKKPDLFDDGDDVVAVLGFGDSPQAERKPAGEQEGPRPARSRLDELLGRGTAATLLARPGTGEHREFKLDRKYQRPQDKEEPGSEEDLDFTFGAYQPTVGSSHSRQTRRQAVRFSAEGAADSKGEPGSKPSVVSSPATQPRKGGADWLGLKDVDVDTGLNLDSSSTAPTREARSSTSLHSMSALPPSGSQRAPSGPSSAPPDLHRGPLTQGSPAPRRGAPNDNDDDQTEDWLSHALSRKRAQGLVREDRETASGDPSSGGLPMASVPGKRSDTAVQETPAQLAPTGPAVTPKQAIMTLSAGDPKQEAAPRHLSGPEPVGTSRGLPEPAGISAPFQGLGISRNSGAHGSGHLQSLLPESLPAPTFPKLPQAPLQSEVGELQAQLLQSQARQAELETQVRKLELEQAQHALLIESLQQRHQADLELLESTHRNRLKVLETSSQQREERLQRENQELSERYLSKCQEAQQACVELSAQHQRRLATALQEKDQELERLQELQRASIQEMRKDHEEQLQRLKALKEREIDAVTSATSHTRSLNGVIEQMEMFSSSLQELTSRVEATHVTATQERELGVRQRDEQLRVLQERLAREQRDMEEERGRLQEMVGRMEARLTEQSRQLEQERWRMSAEQSKAESMQRALEEQRKALGQQMTMEREELEKAKTALLQEQKSVMHKCGEERRRLAAEWGEFFAQQKLSKERAEREAERALQVDSQREGTLVSLAKEQAELKIRATELHAKEDQLVAEREALERERQELRLEKERVNAAALRLRHRSEEVERMSQVASEKYQEGEQALQKAQHIRSEQQARLQLVQQQQQKLREQEQHMHQEQLSLAQQRLQLDRVQQDLPSLPAGLLPRIPGPVAPSLSAPVEPVPAPQSSHLLAPGPTMLHARLLLLRHTAQQDHDFLEEERIFLQTLKGAHSA